MHTKLSSVLPQIDDDDTLILLGIFMRGEEKSWRNRRKKGTHFCILDSSQSNYYERKSNCTDIGLSEV